MRFPDHDGSKVQFVMQTLCGNFALKAMCYESNLILFQKTASYSPTYIGDPFSLVYLYFSESWNIMGD